MSDEEIKPAEAPADEVTSPDASVEVKAEEKPEIKPEGEAPEGEAKPEDDKKKLSGAARAKIREQRLLNELAERDRRIEELSQPKTPAKAAGEGDEKAPEEKDFPDWFAWQRALTAHEAGKKAGEAIDKRLEAREQSERARQQAAATRERETAHLERIEDAREIIADFDQVMQGMKGVNVRPELIEEIKGSDMSAYLTYHLAQNPDKLEALNNLSGRELAREMGRLEASIKVPEAKKQTSAPAPLTPIKGGASGSFDPEAASMDDYVAKRKAGWKG